MWRRLLRKVHNGGDTATCAMWRTQAGPGLAIILLSVWKFSFDTILLLEPQLCNIALERCTSIDSDETANLKLSKNVP